jgi:lipopolysaccharide biosynthesis glycosyltransferase
MNFARFLIFKTFPDIERVIYLDWDMIVIGDIFELENIYVQNDYLVGAELNKNQTVFNNSFVQSFKYSNTINSLNHKDKLKYHMITKVMKYLNVNNIQMFNSMGFNAGFYIVSKDHFDDKYLSELIRKLTTTQAELNCFNFGTQVVMNFMHIDKKKFVPKIWNHLPKLDEKSDDIKIIHWNGLNKPWNDKNDPVNKLWWEYSNKLKLTNNTR